MAHIKQRVVCMPYAITSSQDWNDASAMLLLGAQDVLRAHAASCHMPTDDMLKGIMQILQQRCCSAVIADARCMMYNACTLTAVHVPSKEWSALDAKNGSDQSINRNPHADCMCIAVEF